MENRPLSKIGELGGQYGLYVIRVSSDNGTIGWRKLEFKDVLVAWRRLAE